VTTYLYSSEILIHTSPDPKKISNRINKLGLLAENMRPIYIKGYIYEMISRLYHKIGDIDNSKKSAIHALRYNKDDAIYEWLSTISKANPSQAIVYSRKANELRNTDMMQSLYTPVYAYVVEIEAQTALGHPDIALELAEEYLSRKGLSAKDRKDIMTARKKALNLIRNNNKPSRWLSLLYGHEAWRFATLSRLYEAAGDYGSAAAALARVVEQRSQDMELRLKYIDLLRGSDQDDVAFEAALASVLLKPWGPGYRRCAQICHDRGERDLAMQYAQAARDAEPVNRFHSLFLGQLYAEKGEFTKAESYAQEALGDIRTKADATKLLQKIKERNIHPPQKKQYESCY
jgi:tetratricopeptide (TPR) repeat protein